MLVGFATVILWNTFLKASTGIYELLPAFIFALIAGIVVSLITAPPSEEIEKQFDEAQVYEEE
jgi:Na+/proline symporter